VEPVVRVEREGGVALIILNRPHALNALSRELRTSLTRTFREMQQDLDVGAVILTGAGRAFCAGLDLKELSGEGLDPSRTLRPLSDEDPVGAMQAFDRPIIGALNGAAVTGGFELALACDLLIASTEARFADTHARVGLVPGWGLSQKLPRLIGIGRAKELAFTGNFIDAKQAETWGLVNRVVEPDELIPVCRRLAQDMISCSGNVLRVYKHLIDEGYAGTLSQGLRMESEASVRHSETVSADSIAGVVRSVQERGRSQKGP